MRLPVVPSFMYACLLTPGLLVPAGRAEAGDGQFKTRGLLRKSSAEQVRPALKDRFMSVSLLALDDRSEWYSVPSGETLYSGERMALEVDLQADAYLYVMYQTESGPVTVLYPAEAQENRMLPGGQRYRLPPRNSQFGDILELDDQVGRERLFVVASRQRLPRDARALIPILKKGGPPAASKRQGADAETSRAKPGAGAPKPGVDDGRPPPKKKARMNRMTRGITRQRKSGGVVDAKADRAGIALVNIEINHARRP